MTDSSPRPEGGAAAGGKPEPKLPVACLHISSALGGTERVLLDFLARADGLGIAPLLILPTSGPLVAEAESAGVPVWIAPAPETFLEASQRKGNALAGAAAFVAGLRTWASAIRAALARAAEGPGGRPRVLYTSGFKAHLAGTLLGGYRRVWHVHEFPPEGLGAAWRLVARALPDAVIANSEAVGHAWAQLGGPEATVVLNGVDLDRFKPAPRSFRIHDQLGLDHDARLIGMPAVFARWKGHLQVVEAFERMAGSRADVHLVLVGGPIYDTVAESGYAEELVRRVRRSSAASGETPMPLDGRIHFMRFDPEPWKLYPEFDLVVHFSTRPEPFGRVVVEAAACGVPVIAADAGGPREIVTHGVTGWLTAPGDVPALASLMARALAEDTGPMRLAARRAAEERFDAGRFAAGVAKVLRRFA
jgi:glycosyltransferase involved in cell wall biosynthesis